ncbi:hypothetical protein BDA99DRAFT_529042 [Phascolomyces articulosus]|uniref:RNI-like protein n=1 Tax=Phascolomyces articulosus TaxID=60185 RepID=A0AAD5JWQ4_9FUNG|nr:hypothetical protein BDA99DRAFT_529042 [Phascolomyces articulosus]
MVWGGNDNAVEKWVKQLTEDDPNLTSLHILSMRRLSQDDLKSIFSALTHNTHLKVLYCSGHAIEQEAMDQLSEALTLNDTLETLNIGNSDLGQYGDLLRIFAEGLAVNEGLLHLDFENKGIDDTALSVLAPALIKNTTLRSLNLARNAITRILDEPSSLEHIQSLNMSGNKIDAEGARHLATRLTHLEELDVSNNPLMEGASAMTAALANNTRLQSLKMMGVTTLDEGEEQEETGDATHGNPLMQHLAQSLKTNTTLKRVWLDRNGIESQALETLNQSLGHSSVTELRLRNNKVDNQGATWLAQTTHDAGRRIHLDLGSNAIGYEGFGALLDTSFIHHLGLFNNKINGLPELLPELKKSGVESLDIGCNEITLDDLEAIVTVLVQDGVPHLRLLEMGGNAKEEEMEVWEATITRLQEKREALEVAWKRFIQEQQ